MGPHQMDQKALTKKYTKSEPHACVPPSGPESADFLAEAENSIENYLQCFAPPLLVDVTWATLFAPETDHFLCTKKCTKSGPKDDRRFLRISYRFHPSVSYGAVPV